MKWGELKKEVEEEMKNQGVDNLDDVEIERIDFVSSDVSGGLCIDYDVDKNEVSIY